MQMPKNYDSTAVYGDYVPLTLGGHILTIKSVEEATSAAGKAMLKIFLDTDKSDAQPRYYEADFRADNRPTKKWGCIVNQLVYDNDGNTNKSFKTFIAAVEKSNPGFMVQWGDGFAACFKDKLVGGVFGQEQYRNQKGEAKFATKCFYFRSVETIRNRVEIPADKLLQGVATAVKNDDMDDGLPF